MVNEEWVSYPPLAPLNVNICTTAIVYALYLVMSPINVYQKIVFSARRYVIMTSLRVMGRYKLEILYKLRGRFHELGVVSSTSQIQSCKLHQR